MKLYYVPKTRAGRVRWLLEELAVPYELARLDIGTREHKQPEYLAIHPHGAVPALVDGETTLFESAAICLYLADKYAEKGLAPAPGTPDRGRYYQWIVYGVVTFEPAMTKIVAETKELPEAERAAAMADRGRTTFAEYSGVVERAIDGRTWLLGEQFSAADVILGAIVVWARSLGLLVDRPGLSAYAKRLSDRPASKRARAD
ncbi:MAG: glutathione S-transferase family protein [Myxococcales bacterium]|nr:glutathione S-transferase family protein [Myxococcales bacterium]